MSGVREATADTAAEWAKVRRYGRGGVRRVSCLWSRVAACAPPPKTQNVNRTSNVNPQPTEPVLLVQNNAPQRAQVLPCVDPAAQQPTRPRTARNRDWREPREPRGADDENRSGVYVRSPKPLRRPRRPPAPRATLHS